ncbi:MAG TPA: histidine kinase, partial [Blastocatellia bacterium]|nr:histidine kinase [Blastocatellia bacterium]
MNVISSGVEMNDTGSQQAKGRSFARTVAMVLMVNAASALAVVVLRGLTSAGLTGKQFVEALITSVVYANCCGTLAALAMPRVARRLSRKPFPMSWVYYLGAILVISVIGCLIAVIILTRIGMFPPSRYWLIFRSSLAVSTAIALIIGVSTYFYQRLKHRLELTTRELQLKELEEERARKLALEARLSSLESRIHPHFLFNTLNSISSLIQEDPVLAERLVERLAALLRFSLDSDQSSLVPLERELKIVTDYLEIEKARFGGKLQYSIEVPAELQTVEVPPLSVQTLVENSLKHVVSARREGGEICVTASLAAGRVNIEVRDNGPGFATGALRAGHGLENLQARLIALFDDRAALEWSTREGQTTVTISLPHPE